MKHFIFSAFLFVGFASCNNGTEQNEPQAFPTIPAPAQLSFTMLNAYPHDTSSFTQGLMYYKGVLYESTGNPDNALNNGSWIGPVEITTGQKTKKVTLNAPFFGEGITILNDKVYQITWQNSKCFVYDKKTMVLKNEFTYAGQGWGLCNDGQSIIMSDGSERITFRDPKSFQATKVIEVYDNVGPRAYLNELEYIDGKIYANVYQTGTVLVIEPTTGRVLQEIDANELIVRGKGTGDVLNGIAHNKLTNKTYMTGKYWAKTFEVQFTK